MDEDEARTLAERETDTFSNQVVNCGMVHSGLIEGRLTLTPSQRSATPALPLGLPPSWRRPGAIVTRMRDESTFRRSKTARTLPQDGAYRSTRSRRLQGGR
jgi:hypothetical protein